MRLVHKDCRGEVGFDRIEAPFFAERIVKCALSDPGRLQGLSELIIVCGSTSTSCQQGSNKNRILEAVGRGDWLLIMDKPLSPLSNDTLGLYSHITGRGATASFHPPQPPGAEAPLPDSEPIVTPQPQEPGFYIVPKSTTGTALEFKLFTSPNPAVISKFKALNPNLDQVKAGQMIVLSDPNNLQCTHEEAQLMAAAEKVNAALQDLTPDEADFMMRHRDEIESFLTQGSTAIGTGMAVFASNVDSVKSALLDIEALHQRTFQRDGHLRSPEFFSERKRLFGQLDSHLAEFTKKGIGFPDHPNLKSALGISSRSLVHRWPKAGAPDQIPGYATHMEGVAKAAKYVKYGGWLGIAVGGGASYMKVQGVCTAGDIEACKKVRLTEGGSFIGGVAGGALAGSILTGPTIGAICLGMSVPTGGVAVAVCGLAVVAVGSVAGGAQLGAGGEMAGEMFFEVST